MAAAGEAFRKRTRKEVLEQKKARESTIKAAASITDHLSDFPNLCYYQRNGIDVHLKSGRGDKLTIQTKKVIKSLLKRNMEAPYGPEWPSEEKVKYREMVSVEAHYIFVYAISDENAKLSDLEGKNLNTCYDAIVGFVHYRFILEEEVPVLYVYELQLEPHVQGKGLGQFLMQLIELIARKNGLGAVMLTVQRKNPSARNFYMHKLRYAVSAISPSWTEAEMENHRSYEILCKTIEEEAQDNLLQEA